MNRVKDRTRSAEIERSVARVLSELSIEFGIERWTSDTNAMVEVGRRGHRATYRLVWLPHPTLSEVAQLDGIDRDDRLLVVGPRISSRTADALRDARIEYVDYAGNAYLDIGPVLVDIRGRRAPAIEPGRRATDANLFSAKRMQVVFVLLAWPDAVGLPVRAIAEAAGTSVGITQSTLDILKESDYLLGRSLHRRDELLDLWTAAFRGALLPKIRRDSFRGDIESWSAPAGYAISGESAVETIRNPQTLTIYATRFDLADAVTNGWRKSDEPNIEIRQQFWNEPQVALPSERRNIFVAEAAPPLLVYADLITSNEPRQIEVAKMLRKDRLV